MPKTRDITQAQFLAALKRHGLRSVGFMGYVELPCGLSSSALNFPTYRAALAYFVTLKDSHHSKPCETCTAQHTRALASREKRA